MTKVKLILVILMPFWLFFVSGASYGRYAAIMIDADNGNVLHEVESTHPWYPASLTKVMTLYMAFDALNSGQLHLYDTMTTSYHASGQPTSKLGLRVGERLTVEDAILAIITRSANDAAVVLAEHLGGTEEEFANKMTAKARSIGMHSTRFMNATGLPNDWQVTTSRDMAIMAWKIKRNYPNYYPYFSSHSFYYKGRELRGINKFTAHYPGAEGMKTGYTCGSGFNLIGAAHQNGKNLIGVVLGGMTSAERYRLMMEMMDSGFSSRYSADSGININTMPAGFGGEPPYQLNCGKGFRNQVASYKSADNSGHGNKRKFAGKSKRYSKKGLVAKSKGISSARISKTKKTGRSLLASKSKGIKTAVTRKSTSPKKKANASKLLAKAKPASKGKLVKAGKSKSVVKVNAGKSTRYHRNS